MKYHRILPFLAIAAASNPSIASAGGEPPVRVDSTLSFNLRIISEGDESERNNVSTNRFETARFGSREALARLEAIASLQNGFPRGSRLEVLTNGQIWVVDRDGAGVFNATPYLTLTTDRGDGVTAGTFDGNNGDERSTQVFSGAFSFSFSVNQAIETEVVEVVGPSADQAGADGLLTERFSRRYNRFRETSTVAANISGRVAGTGSESGDPIAVDGTIHLRGREVSIDD